MSTKTTATVYSCRRWNKSYSPPSRFFLVSFLPSGGAASSVPTPERVAAHLRQLDPARRGVEGLPGGQDEGQRRGTGCLASHQAWRSPYTGTGAGGLDRWMEKMLENRPFLWKLCFCNECMNNSYRHRVSACPQKRLTFMYLKLRLQDVLNAFLKSVSWP